MKGKRLCSLLAGVLNLLYALTLTGGLVLGIIMCIASALGLNPETSDFAAAMAAIVGALLMAVAIIAIIIILPPCICTWISSIGLIKRAVKDRHPKGPAILSIVIHSLMIIGFVIGYFVADGQDWVKILIAIGFLMSLVNIVLCGIALSGKNSV